jgi:hypothetical protein
MELPDPTLNLAKGFPPTDPPGDSHRPKIERLKAGAASWLAVLLVAWVFFSGDYNLLAIRNIRAHPIDR